MSLTFISISERVVFILIRLLIGGWLLCALAWGQQVTSSWQEEVRRRTAAHDWTAALDIVDREVSRSPKDMDIRAWRARILQWSGRLKEAELEYQEILAAVPNDPDNWMGLAAVYSREGRNREALQALDRSVELDPKRADIRAARGAALRTLGAEN